MKKSVVILGLSSMILLSSCGTSTGSGALSGAMFGGWFGSAIGGIMGGPRGHDVGTLIGMATGATVGAAAGAAEDQRQQERIEGYHRRVADRDYSYSGSNDTYSDDTYATSSANADYSGFDSSNSGDDRIDFQPSTAADTIRTAKEPSIVLGDFLLKNIHFVDSNGDGVLQRREFGKISFEIKNMTREMQYDLIPSVVEADGNTHVIISPSAHIENIAPGQTLRYTAMVKADSSLKDGTLTFKVSVSHLGKTVGNELTISIPSSKVRISN